MRNLRNRFHLLTDSQKVDIALFSVQSQFRGLGRLNEASRSTFQVSSGFVFSNQWLHRIHRPTGEGQFQRFPQNLREYPVPIKLSFYWGFAATEEVGEDPILVTDIFQGHPPANVVSRAENHQNDGHRELSMCKPPPTFVKIAVRRFGTQSSVTLYCPNQSLLFSFYHSPYHISI